MRFKDKGSGGAGGDVNNLAPPREVKQALVVGPAERAVHQKRNSGRFARRGSYRGSAGRLTATCTASTTIKIGNAGASIHGASASIDTFEASCSMVPQVATSCGNPSPTNDIVASASMNAGKSNDACVNTYPLVAGSR